MPSSDAEDRTAAASEPNRLAVAVGMTIAVAMTATDQLVKAYVERVLTAGEFVSWLGPHIGWQLVYNPHGAFGIPAPNWVFLLVTLLVLGIVLRNLPRVPNLWQAAAFGLLLAGALGNAIDRVIRPGDGSFGGGFVVDFVAWGTFPRFNVADAAITVGFVLLVFSLWVDERQT